MPSSGPRSPANAAQGGTGVAWTNAGNIIASNNSYASVALNSSNNTSQRIYGFAFGFALPDGATVDGILAEYELKSDSAFRTDLIEAYVFDRATSTTVPVATKTNTTTLGTSDAYISRGGSADDWGLTGSHLDAAFINSADFGVGVRLALSSTLSQTPTLDHIRVTVWYTELVTSVALDGTANGTATVSGSLAVEIALSGMAAGTATVTGTLETPVPTSTITVASPRRDPAFYVAIYPHPSAPNSRNRLDWIDINPDLTGLSWSSTMPGGFARFQAGHNNHERPLSDPLIPRELQTAEFARVEITDGALTLWEGRIEDRDEAPQARRTLVVSGWGYSATHDMPYFSTSSTEATTGNVLKAVLANAAPLLRPAFGDLYVDPQVPHAPSEFDAWYPSQVLDQISKEGDDDGNLMDWAVWEGRVLTLRPRVAPTTADYFLPYDRRYISDWKRHAKDRRGVVWVDHTVSDVPTRTGPISDLRFVDAVGFQRGRVLKVGEMSVSAATRIARTFLAFHSRERYTGVVTIGPDDVLIGSGGRPVPAYMARAGQWVQVGDYEPLMIVVQEYNANARRQKLTLGGLLDTYEVRVAQTMREAELRKLGSNPLGGRV